jgi:hypothetical protein
MIPANGQVNAAPALASAADLASSSPPYSSNEGDA